MEAIHKAYQGTIDYEVKAYRKFFNDVAWNEIERNLSEFSEHQKEVFLNFQFKDPQRMIWMAFPLGLFGVDRFILEDQALGVFKLLTLGHFGIGFLVDTFTVVNRTKNYNFQKFLQIKMNKIN